MIRKGLSNYASCCVALVVLSTCTTVRGEEQPHNALIPATSTLSGPHASQQLLVEGVVNGRFTSDKTNQAKFTSGNPAVATVDNAGVVRPVSDGETTITAMIDGQTVSATVNVTAMGSDPGHNFRNDVQPVLAKMGCSMGACHGALAGKGGFKLSLRGYDSMADYLAITRNARGRRIERTDHGRILLLLKPSMAVPHKG